MKQAPPSRPRPSTLMHATGDQVTFGSHEDTVHQKTQALLKEMNAVNLTQATNWSYSHARDPEFKIHQAYSFQVNGTRYTVRHFQADPETGRSYVQTPQYRIRRGQGAEYDITRKEFEALAAQIEPHAKTATAANFGFNEDLNLVPVLARAALASLDNPAANINIHNRSNGYFSVTLPPDNGDSPLEDTEISIHLDHDSSKYQSVFFTNKKGAYDAPVIRASETQALFLFEKVLKTADTQRFIQSMNGETIPEWQEYISSVQRDARQLRVQLEALIGAHQG